MKEQKQKRRTRLAALLLALAVGVGVAIPTGVFAQTPTPANAQPETSQSNKDLPKIQPKAGNDDGTSVEVSAKKVLQNSDGTPAALKAGQFTFALMEDGADVATATNDADGNIQFNLSIGEDDFSKGSESATKTYTMVERRGADSSISYDRNQHTVTVRATRDVKKKLGILGWRYEYSNYQASVTSAAPTFTNKIGAGVTPEPLGEPKHQKQAILNEDGTYTLSLDVTGKSETKAKPVDVVLVADESSSMNDDERMEDLKKAAKVFSSSLLTTANAELDPQYQTQIALIGFSDSARIVNEFTASQTDLNGKIDTLYPRGNTNWAAGLREAQQLSSGRQDTQKYIVFLTDGNPAESGRPFTTSWYNEGVQAGKQIVDSGTTLISVGINIKSMYWVDATKDKITNWDYSNWTNPPSAAYRRSLEAFSIRVGSQYYDGDNEDLTKVFENIAETINRAYKNVSITDILSDYVEFAEDAKVQVTASNGSPLVEGTDYTTEIDKETKTVTLHLLKPLANNVTYTISYAVKLSQLACDTYPAYPDTGETGTGTHAGKAGFYANKQAWVDYTDADGSVQKTEYDQPVVQLQLQSIPVRKAWQSVPPAGTTVTANLYMDGKPETPVQSVTLTDGASTPDDPLDDWKGVFKNLVPGHSYTVVETQVPNYTSEVTPSEGISLTTDKLYDGDGFTITNALGTATIYIQKLGLDGVGSDLDPNPLSNARFTLYKQDQTGADVQPKEVSGSTGKFVLSDLPLGTYFLEESRSPDGYQLLAKWVQFTVSADGVELAEDTSDQISLNPEKDTINITDTKKPVLPLTGGSGTVWFLIIGGVLIGGALALLIWQYIIRKNKKAN